MIPPKFRGRCKETNQWVYGFGWMETDYTKEYLQGFGQTKQDGVLYTKQGAVYCDINSMGQFSGFVDKNGKEIFHGDILQGQDYPVRDEDAYLFVVEQNIGGFFLVKRVKPNAQVRGISDGIADLLLEFDGEDLEVLGNIYEHADLIRI